MNDTNAPCKECKIRKIGCHSKCNMYHEWLIDKQEASRYNATKIKVSKKYEDDIKRWCR